MRRRVTWFGLLQRQLEAMRAGVKPRPISEATARRIVQQMEENNATMKRGLLSLGYQPEGGPDLPPPPKGGSGVREIECG